MAIISQNTVKSGFFADWTALVEKRGKRGVKKDYVRNYKLKIKNRANLPDGQIDAISAIAMTYGDFGRWRHQKNKANSKPIAGFWSEIRSTP